MLEMLLHSPEEVSSGNDYVLKQTAANQTTNWIVPNGVTSICCVCVGHGAISGEVVMEKQHTRDARRGINLIIYYTLYIYSW